MFGGFSGMSCVLDVGGGLVLICKICSWLFVLSVYYDTLFGIGVWTRCVFVLAWLRRDLLLKWQWHIIAFRQGR